MLEYTGGDRGWIGDNPFIFLDTSRIRALGWAPKLTIREGIIAHARLPAGATRGCSRRAHEGRGSGAVAPRFGDGRVPRRRRARGDGLRPRPGERLPLSRPADRRSPSPGLSELIARGLAVGRAAVHDRICRGGRGADVVWVTFDTPVDEDDRADVEYVERQVEPRFRIWPTERS